MYIPRLTTGNPAAPFAVRGRLLVDGALVRGAIVVDGQTICDLLPAFSDFSGLLLPCGVEDVVVQLPAPGTTAAVAVALGPGTLGTCFDGSALVGIDFTFREPSATDPTAGMRSAMDGPFVGARGHPLSGRLADAQGRRHAQHQELPDRRALLKPLNMS